MHGWGWLADWPNIAVPYFVGAAAPQTAGRTGPGFSRRGFCG
jgi:hypothetical protein